MVAFGTKIIFIVTENESGTWFVDEDGIGLEAPACSLVCGMPENVKRD